MRVTGCQKLEIFGFLFSEAAYQIPESRSIWWAALFAHCSFIVLRIGDSKFYVYGLSHMQARSNLIALISHFANLCSQLRTIVFDRVIWIAKHFGPSNLIRL